MNNYIFKVGDCQYELIQASKDKLEFALRKFPFSIPFVAIYGSTCNVLGEEMIFFETFSPTSDVESLYDRIAIRGAITYLETTYATN